MKKTYMTLVAAALALSAASTQAVTLNITSRYLYGDPTVATASRLAIGSTLLLIADTSNNGLGDMTLADSWTGGQADNIVLKAWASDGTGGAVAAAGRDIEQVSFTSVAPGLGGVEQNDRLYLVWFDRPFALYNPATGPGAGIEGGSYRTDSQLDGSSFGWVVPDNGVSGDLVIKSTSVTGSVDDTLTTTSFVTAGEIIPEPSTAVTVAFGLLGLGAVLRRRR